MVVPWGATQALLLQEHGLSPFPLLEHDCSLDQHISLCFLEYMVFFAKYIFEQLIKKIIKRQFFFIHCIMDENENSKKGSNLGPLGYEGDFNYCIYFFLLKTM